MEGCVSKACTIIIVHWLWIHRNYKMAHLSPRKSSQVTSVFRPAPSAAFLTRGLKSKPSSEVFWQRICLLRMAGLKECRPGSPDPARRPGPLLSDTPLFIVLSTSPVCPGCYGRKTLKGGRCVLSERIHLKLSGSTWPNCAIISPH